MLNRLHIAICEDNPEDAALLKGLIEAPYGDNVEVSVFSRASDFWRTFERHRYDLLFFDIYIGEDLGIDLAVKVRAVDKDAVIAFSSVSEEFTKESYRLGAYSYLVKPPRPEAVREMVALAQMKSGQRERARRVILTGGGDTVELAADDILYVEANGYTSVVHTLSGPVDTRYTVDALEKLLEGPQFLRCHRGYLVNMDHVERIEDDFIMQGGGIAYIRVKDRRQMRAAYERYLFDSVREGKA